jgi:hypothetical protein
LPESQDFIISGDSEPLAEASEMVTDSAVIIGLIANDHNFTSLYC